MVNLLLKHTTLYHLLVWCALFGF